jgi:diacylglycerol O-acyltransferase
MERLSDLDTFFLASETATQHLHVMATMVFDRSDAPGRFDYETFRDRVAERYQLIGPLKRRLSHAPLSRPFWIDDDHLHLDRHLHHLVLPRGGGLPALAAAVADIASFSLEKDRPLWDAWFIEGINDEDVAVVAKIHHCAVDGVSGIYALAEFFDLERAPAPREPADPPGAVTRPGAFELGRATVGELLHAPERIVRGAWHLGRSALTVAIGRSESAPLPFTGPKQSYNRALTQDRSVAFTTIRLEDVKLIRKNSGASVNDVLVALCAGILRKYAIDHGEEPTRPLVAAVPVSERKPEHGSAGNQISFMFYSLPVHRDEPGTRLAEVVRSARATKELYEKTGEGLLGSVATVAPSGAVGPVMRMLSGLRIANVAPPIANVTISNIRAPDLPLYAAGARLKSLFPMGPLLEGVGLGVTVVSYGDKVDFGFLGCEDYLPDIECLAEATHLEVARMLDAVAPAT